MILKETCKRGFPVYILSVPPLFFFLEVRRHVALGRVAPEFLAVPSRRVPSLRHCLSLTSPTHLACARCAPCRFYVVIRTCCYPLGVLNERATHAAYGSAGCAWVAHHDGGARRHVAGGRWRAGRRAPASSCGGSREGTRGTFGLDALRPVCCVDGRHHRQRRDGQKEKQEYVVCRTDPVCCIYHKPRAFDESSSESSDSDSDGSSSSAPESSSDDDGAARPSRGMRHRHTHRCKHGRTPDAAGPKANAYERP